MAQKYEVVVEIDGKQYEVVVEADSPEEAQQLAQTANFGPAPVPTQAQLPENAPMLPGTANDPRAAALRGGLKGVAGLGDFAIGVVTKIPDLAADYWAEKSPESVLAQKASAATSFLDDTLDLTDNLEKAFDKVGWEAPTNKTAKRIENIAEVVGGSLGGIGAGRWLAAKGFEKAGAFLSAQPGLQIGSAVTGEAARQVVEETGGGAGAQLAASLIGGFAPASAISFARSVSIGGREAQKKLLRDLEDARVTDDLLEELGDNKALRDRLVSHGLITEDELGQSLKILATKPDGVAGAVLGSSAGAARRLKAEADKAERQIGAALAALSEVDLKEAGLLREAAGTFAGVDTRQLIGDAGDAGAAIDRAVRNFTMNFKRTTSGLYKEADEAVIEAMKVLKQNDPNFNGQLSAERFLATLEDILPEGTIAESLASQQLLKLKSEVLKKVEASGGTLSWADLKDIRRVLAKKMNAASLLDDAPHADIKRLWGAVSDDIATATKLWDGAAGTNASAALNKATTAYSQGRALLDDNLRFITMKLDQKGMNTEQLFDTVVTQTSKAPSRIDDLMKVMEESDQLARGAAMNNGKAIGRLKVQSEALLRKVEAGTATEAERTAVKAVAAELESLTPKMLEDISNTRNTDILRSALIQRMGLPNASSTKPFSLSTFITRFQQADIRSMQRIFKGKEGQLRALQSLVRIASRQKAQVKNSTRVNDVMVGLAQVGGGGAALTAATGGISGMAVLGGVGLSMLTANRAAALLTNRKFIEYMLRHQKKAFGTATISGLIQVADENPDIAEDVREIVKGLGIWAGTAGE